METKSIFGTPQTYIPFENFLKLYKYEGVNTMILAESSNLDSNVMTSWLNAMDAAFNFYLDCTGKLPACYANNYINGKVTIAQVPHTCGAGCGRLGNTGIEFESKYFDGIYENLLNNNLYDQSLFYEFGRNSWFYDQKLKYKISNDPIATGYAVFMRFMAMEHLGLNGANFDKWKFAEFQSKVKNLLMAYKADSSLNWSNTLGVGKGIKNSELSETDLFASFCFYLKETYGMSWVQNVWKKVADRPNINTTQDAVDNFVIAASQSANVNLVSLFQFWKWSPSDSAIAYLNSELQVSSSMNHEENFSRYKAKCEKEI